MSNPGDADATPITSLQQLADHIAAGCKPAEQFRIGTEHEKFGFRLADLADAALRTGGRPARLDSRPAGGAWPVRRHADRRPRQHHRPEAGRRGDLAGTCRTARAVGRAAGDAARHQRGAGGALRPGARRRSATCRSASLPLGFHPTATREQMPWMPKGRYAIMRRYMPLVGTLGLDMMTRTCTVQVNLDYASEQDMLRKLRVSLLLQPLATALFANSPFTEGRPERLPVVSRPGLDRHRQRPFRHPRGDVRARLRLRALRRVAGRPRADVFRLSRRPIYRCRRRIVPRLHERAAAQR